MEVSARHGSPPPAKDYKPEFRELGVEAVRKELLRRRWAPEKLAAARLWVENQDTQSWAAGRGDAEPSVERKKAFRRWAVYIAVGFGLAYVTARILRSLF